jgi:hypothetical protein
MAEDPLIAFRKPSALLEISVAIGRNSVHTVALGNAGRPGLGETVQARDAEIDALSDGEAASNRSQSTAPIAEPPADDATLKDVLCNELLEWQSRVPGARLELHIALFPDTVDCRRVMLPAIRESDLFRVVRRELTRYVPQVRENAIAAVFGDLRSGGRSLMPRPASRRRSGPDRREAVLVAAAPGRIIDALFETAAACNATIVRIVPAVVAWTVHAAKEAAESNPPERPVVGVTQHADVIHVTTLRDGRIVGLRRFRAERSTSCTRNWSASANRSTARPKARRRIHYLWSSSHQKRRAILSEPVCRATRGRCPTTEAVMRSRQRLAMLHSYRLTGSFPDASSRPDDVWQTGPRSA